MERLSLGWPRPANPIQIFGPGRFAPSGVPGEIFVNRGGALESFVYGKFPKTMWNMYMFQKSNPTKEESHIRSKTGTRKGR